MTQYYLTREDELYHWGIKGQKWGQRRWQNEDGSLTPAGREHYGYGAKAEYKNRVGIAKANYIKALTKSVKSNSDSKGRMTKAQIKKFDEESKKLGKQLADEKKAAKQEYKNSDEYYKNRQENIKKAVKVGAAVAATALVAYGAYKIGKLKVEQANKIIEGRKLCAKTIANSNRELYSQVSGFYQGKGYSDPKHYPVNRLSDAYTKILRKDMAKYQKNITEASKLYNEADKASKSSNLNKLKTAYKYAKESGIKSRKDYNDLLERANDYIERDRSSRALWSPDDKNADYFNRLNKSIRRMKNK